MKTKIRPLWVKLYSLLEDCKENKEIQKLIYKASIIMVFIDSIDEEIFKWLKLAVEFIEDNFSARYFIEYLLKHADNSPDKVGKLYNKMLTKGIYPLYEEEKIIKIIMKLKENNQKEEAIKICNMYLNKGFYFVRPLLEKK